MNVSDGMMKTVRGIYFTNRLKRGKESIVKVLFAVITVKKVSQPVNVGYTSCIIYVSRYKSVSIIDSGQSKHNETTSLAFRA